MIETIKVSSRGQIVIPDQVRKDLGIEEGTKLILVERGKRIILEKEQDFMRALEHAQKEKAGWLILTEKNLAKIWDNPQDEEAWSRYL